MITEINKVKSRIFFELGNKYKKCADRATSSVEKIFFLRVANDAMDEAKKSLGTENGYVRVGYRQAYHPKEGMANLGEDEVVCSHSCTSNCRRVGCNCECGEFHRSTI